MNWGKGIVFTLSVFVLFIAGLSIYMFSTPQDDYDHAYYEKGLNFDKDFIKEENVVKDHAQPQIQVGKYAVILDFHKVSTGTVKFERPSDTRMDKVFPVDSSKLIVPVTSLAQGEWQLTFNWRNSGHQYLYQQKIFIP